MQSNNYPCKYTSQRSDSPKQKNHFCFIASTDLQTTAPGLSQGCWILT